MNIPDGLLSLLHRPSICFLATLMPDGSPQLTQTWVDTDDKHILINTVQSHQKVRNIERDPRVAVTISDPDHPARYYTVRGTVIDMTTEGARKHIDELSWRYLGKAYPQFGGPDEIRILLTIEPARVTPQT